MLSMVTDHANKAFLYYLVYQNHGREAAYAVNYITYGIGRIAFPLFLFMTVEAYFHTRNKTRYLCSLLLLGLISIPCDNLMKNGHAGLEAVTGSLFSVSKLNVLFTLALGFASIWLIDRLKEKHLPASGKAVHFLTAALIGLAAGKLASKLHMDYGMGGVLAIVLTCLMKEEKKECAGVFLAGLLLGLVRLRSAGYAMSPGIFLQCLSSLAAVFVYFYNGKRGNIRRKYLFYLFYPAHLAVLGLIALAVLG